jgi:hypothetical protein
LLHITLIDSLVGVWHKATTLGTNSVIQPRFGLCRAAELRLGHRIAPPHSRAIVGSRFGI